MGWLRDLYSFLCIEELPELEDRDGGGSNEESKGFAQGGKHVLPDGVWDACVDRRLPEDGHGRDRQEHVRAVGQY